MCDRDFRLPVGSRHGNFPHETFFPPGTYVAGGLKHLYQGKKKSRVENSHDEIITCSFWCSTNFFHQLSFAVLISSVDTATRCNTQIQQNREISQCQSHPGKPLFFARQTKTCQRLMH